MKYLILGVIFLSSQGFAKEDLQSFQDELLSTVNSEIKKDDFHLKKNASPERGPASIKELQHPHFKTAPKIDKNLKQTGLSDW